VKANSNVLTAAIPEPVKMTILDPYLSTTLPMIGREKPVTSMLMVVASARVVTVLSNSLDIGTRKIEKAI
jgi:hypothetical protein